MESISAIFPILKNPEVKFSVRPLHGKRYCEDDEPISVVAEYAYGDARDLCQWLTNPALVANAKSYEAMVFLKAPYDMKKVDQFILKIVKWHKNASIPDEKELPQEVLRAFSFSLLPEVLTATEAAELWSLDPSTVKKACQQGRFTEQEARKSEGTWLITRAAIMRLYGEPKKKE